MHIRPTLLDVALAEHPSAEADSRAVAAAAIPPSWTHVDEAARHFQRLLDDARQRMVEEVNRAPATKRAKQRPEAG
jgi:hypothetical protein